MRWVGDRKCVLCVCVCVVDVLGWGTEGGLLLHDLDLNGDVRHFVSAVVQRRRKEAETGLVSRNEKRGVRARNQIAQSSGVLLDLADELMVHFSDLETSEAVVSPPSPALQACSELEFGF